ncbi:MAG: hypothetical protein IKI63_05455, partial [Clostridia bacterium]|nr:hypothetical protein [Clostridia bacterium]
IDIALYSDEGEQLWSREGYSIKTYCDEQIAGSTDDNLVALCKAIVNYGATAQTYFDYNADNLATAGGDYGSLPNPTIDATPVITQGATDFHIDSATLLVQTDTAVRIYYTLSGNANIDDFMFGLAAPTGSRMHYRLGTVGSRRCIEVYGIESTNLDGFFTVTAINTVDHTVSAITYSPFCYLKSRVAENYKDPHLRDLCRALYLYATTADAYFSTLPEFSELLDDTIIFDGEIDQALYLEPGATLHNAEIAGAFINETAMHGIAAQYIITAQVDADPATYVYPGIYGRNDSEGWVDETKDHAFIAGQNSTIYGSVPGTVFMGEGDLPQNLYFRTDELDSTSLTVNHIRIQVVRRTEPEESSEEPSEEPMSEEPSEEPSETPSEEPSEEPVSEEPSEAPSEEPSAESSEEPVTGDTLVAQWTATGDYGSGDVGGATFYTRTGCAGTTTTESGTVSQNWGAFQTAYDHLEDNQYMVISISNLPPTDNATLATGFELRGYKAPGAADGTGTYFKPANNPDMVTITKANSANLTVRIDGPLAHNNNSKQEVKYNFSGLGGSIKASSPATAPDVYYRDIALTVSIYEKGSAVSVEPSEEPSETPSEEPSVQPSEESSEEPTNDTVIYDADVSGTLTLAAGNTFASEAITAALAAETAAHGVAERYLITVTGSGPAADDYIYPILIGANGTEVWPSNDYDHDYQVGQTGITYGSVLGSTFAAAGDAPANLYLYAESGNATMTVTHIKIEVVRSGQTPTPSSSSKPTTTTTSSGGSGNDGRPTGSGDFTYVGGTPYITFRSYGDEGTLGTWWWYTDDAENTTKCTTYLDFLYMNGVDEIYFYGWYWMDGNNSAKAKLHSFVQKANAKGMKVSLIYDDTAIAESSNTRLSSITTTYLAYCNTYPTDQMAGIHFDVEGVARSGMVNYMISQFKAARDRGLPITMDVNCGWTDNITYQGITGFMNIAAANLDCLSLMSYRDTGNAIWSLGSKPLAAAKTYGTKIVFGVETGQFDFNADNVEFAQEGKEVCYTELAKVYRNLQNDHPSGGYGIAVHAVDWWYKLKNT